MNWKIIVTIYFCVLMSTFGMKGQGLIIEDTIIQAIPLDTIPDSKSTGMPSKYSLRSYCPQPKNQGKLPICVGMAAGYGGRTIYRAVEENVTYQDYITKELAHSARYVFERCGGDYKKGAKLSDAIRLLVKEGDCLYADLDRNETKKISPIPTNVIQKAAQYKIKQYSRAFDPTFSPNEKIKHTKRQIAQKKAVIVGFYTAPNSEDDTYFYGKKNWQPDTCLATSGHAMVVVGYDDTLQEFELMNSYGPSWADGGFCKISYQDYAQFVINGYVLKKGIPKGNNFTKAKLIPPYQANMWVEKFNPTTLSPEKMTVQFMAENSIYQATMPSENKEEEYTITVQLPKGSCFYLIQDNNVRPFLEASIKYVPTDTTLIFPGDGAVFNTTIGIDDYFIGLFSFEPIEDIEEKLSLMEFEKQSSFSKIHAAFQEDLIDKTRFNYAPQSAAFETIMGRSAGHIIPIILKIN